MLLSHAISAIHYKKYWSKKVRGLFLTIFFALLALTQTVYAISCTPVKIKIENNIIIFPDVLQPNTSQIYFFKNNSPQSIFIDRVNKNPGASAGWSTYLRPGNWAVLAINQKNFAVSCVMIQPGRVIPLNCSRTLFVCIPQNIVTLTPLKGNYWLVEDKPWEGLLKTLQKKNIKIN